MTTRRRTMRWQLGTRPKGDPEGDAVRDHRELTLLLRAEVSAIARGLIETGMLTEERWLQLLGEETEALDRDYEHRFPGIRSSHDGLVFYDANKARRTMQGWRP